MSKHDDKIEVLLEKVEEQKNGLGTKPRAVWNTNGIFKYTDEAYFNLNTIKNDFQPFIDALSFLLTIEEIFSLKSFFIHNILFIIIDIKLTLIACCSAF